MDSRSSPLLVTFGSGVSPTKVKRWTVKHLTRNISKTVTDTRLDPPGALTCRTNRLSIGAVTFDLGWPWGSKIKVKLFDVKYVKKRLQLRCWTHRLHFGWPWEVKGQGHKRGGNGDRHVGIYASQVNWRTCYKFHYNKAECLAGWLSVCNTIQIIIS